jgi:NRDE-2, necessary for RNA interference
MGWQNYKTKKIQLKKRYFSFKALKDRKSSLDDDEEDKRPSWDHDVVQDLKSTTADLNRFGYFEMYATSTNIFDCRTVALNPCDIEAWMKLVRIQPYLLSLQPRNGPCFLSAQEKRAVADKQVAIIDKALGSNPTNPLLVKERLVSSFVLN